MSDEEQVTVDRQWYEPWSPTVFWQRYQVRELTDFDVQEAYLRIVIPLLLPLMLTGLWLTGEGAAKDWAVTWAEWVMWPAYLAIYLALSYRASACRTRLKDKLWLVTKGVALTYLCAWLSMGGFLMVNALTGDGDKPVPVYGKVIDKGSEYTRVMGFGGYLTVRYQGQPVKLPVTYPEFRSHEVGDEYGQVLYRGGFGYYYRWEWFSTWK